jgi:hypothetical protein
VAALLMLQGCHGIGDTEYDTTMHLDLRTEDLDDAEKQVLAAVEPLGFRKGGQWLLDGKTCSQMKCARTPEARGKFMEKADWVDAPEQRTSSDLSFFIAKMREDGTPTHQQSVKITREAGTAKVEIRFHGLGRMPVQERDDYQHLAQRLNDQFDAGLKTEAP